MTTTSKNPLFFLVNYVRLLRNVLCNFTSPSEKGIENPVCIISAYVFSVPVSISFCHLAVQSYRILWTGLGAQLARDVPFSVICWQTLEPVRFH